MSTETLLSAITLRLASHPENVATEALLHILRAHPSAGRTLLGFLSHAGLPSLHPLTYRTQVVGAEGSIPDLVGFDLQGQERLLLEAKFWAHLTANQPETYLSRLNSGATSILLFVCPEARQPSLWDLVRARCDNGDSLRLAVVQSQLVTWSQLDSEHNIAVTSWRAILGSIDADAAAHGDRLYQANVEQLQGLCDRMDSEAFLPLRRDELSQEIGRRVSQFADLVDETMDHLKRDPDISTKNLSTGGSHSGYGRFFLYKQDYGLFLHYSPALWSRNGASPLWLQFHRVTQGKWAPAPFYIQDILQHYTSDSPSRLTELGGTPNLALQIPCGAEKSEVVAELREQIVKVLDFIINRGTDA